MSHEPLRPDLLNSTKPQQVRTYVLSKGWERIPEARGEIALFHHPQGDLAQLIIPMEKSLTDYDRRMRDVVENLAEFEARPALEVLNDLLAPEADILRYRVVSPATVGGSIPLMEGLRLLEGARRSLLSAACTVVNPVAHHARMSRSEAQQLLNAAQLGQTERASFAVSVHCPLRAVEQDQSLLPGTEPFTRQAISVLMRSLSRIVRSIETDTVHAICKHTAEEPVISANLCDSILQMQPQEQESYLDIQVSWAPTMRPHAQLPAAVRIKQEYFPLIEDIYKELRPAKAPEASLFIGYVDALNGQPGDDGRVQGDVTISVLHEEELHKAHADLGPDDYQAAIQAHAVAGAIKFKGVLHLGRRLHRISDVTEFDSVR